MTTTSIDYDDLEGTDHDASLEGGGVYAPGCEPAAATEETISPRLRGDAPVVRADAPIGVTRGKYSDAPPATERPQGATMHPIGTVKPSPTNPRKTFRGLEELAETIREHGILQPLVARPRGTNGSSYLELVFGERRLRAAGLAGLKEVPVLVRDMTDLEVLEVQIVENVQRQDVDALEEADGFKVLHEKHEYSAQDIAAKIGKSVAYVYARLKLCALGPEGRKALADGLLTDSTALLVARVPLALQAQAVKELKPGKFSARDESDECDPVGAREAFARIQSRFMLRLADAPFETGDAKLVPEAGSCTTCVKRSGNQPELFADVKMSDTCTDPTCFATKRDAAWAKRKVEAKAAGVEVIEGKKAKEFFPYAGHLSHTSGMVDLDAEDYSDSKRRTHRERLGKRLEEAAAPVTLVRTEDGKVHELVPAKEVKKLLPKPKSADERPVAPTVSAADKMKREAERAANLVALGQVVKKVEAKELNRDLWRILISGEISQAYGDLDEVLERRGILNEDDPVEAREKKIDVAISRLDGPALRGLYVELILGRDVGFRNEADSLTLFCRDLNIDLKQLVAKELARLKADAKKPPAPASKKARSPISTAAIAEMPAGDAKAVTKAKKQLAKKASKK